LDKRFHFSHGAVRFAARGTRKQGKNWMFCCGYWRFQALEQAGIAPVLAAPLSRIRSKWANFMEFGENVTAFVAASPVQWGKAKHCEAVSRMVDRKKAR
jgi:hypothetical protein